MLFMLTLLACLETEAPTCADDTGAATSGEDTGRDEGGEGGEGVDAEPRLATEVLVDLRLEITPEGPWDIDLVLDGDGLFADRVARAELTLQVADLDTPVVLDLDPHSVTDHCASHVEGWVGQAKELDPMVTYSVGVPLDLDEPDVIDVDFEEVEDASLPMAGQWVLPEGFNSPMVYAGLTPDGELILRLQSAGEGAHYPVGGFLDGETVVEMRSQQHRWQAPQERVDLRLEDGAEMDVSLKLYDEDGGLVGSVARTAMYGDIIVGGVALDDFND
jgi:hypothetical protein